MHRCLLWFVRMNRLEIYSTKGWTQERDRRYNCLSHNQQQRFRTQARRRRLFIAWDDISAAQIDVLRDLCVYLRTPIAFFSHCCSENSRKQLHLLWCGEMMNVSLDRSILDLWNHCGSGYHRAAGYRISEFPRQTRMAHPTRVVCHLLSVFVKPCILGHPRLLRRVHQRAYSKQTNSVTENVERSTGAAPTRALFPIHYNDKLPCQPFPSTNKKTRNKGSTDIAC